MSLENKRKKSDYIISDLSNMVLKGHPELVLKQLPDQSVDMIFTSPSYYDAKGKISKYDTYEGFLALVRKVVRECYRTLIDGKFFIINTGHVLLPRASRSESSTRIPVPFDIHRILAEEGFEFMDDIIWQKPEGAGIATARGTRFSVDRNPMQYKALPVTEYVMVYRKKSAVLIDHFIRNHPDQELIRKSKIADGYEKTNVWRIAATKDKNYPGVLPRELVEKVISYYSFVNDVVLDPFGGIGTTAMAAASLKRRFVAIESADDCVETMRSELDNLPDMFNYFEYEYKDYSALEPELESDQMEMEVDALDVVRRLLEQGVEQKEIVKALEEKFGESQ